jgi:hypothetical protein
MFEDDLSTDESDPMGMDPVLDAEQLLVLAAACARVAKRPAHLPLIVRLWVSSLDELELILAVQRHPKVIAGGDPFGGVEVQVSSSVPDGEIYGVDEKGEVWKLWPTRKPFPTHALIPGPGEIS